MSTENREIVPIEVIEHEDTPHSDIEEKAHEEWNRVFADSGAKGRSGTLVYLGGTPHSSGSSYLRHRYEGTLIR